MAWINLWNASQWLHRRLGPFQQQPNGPKSRTVWARHLRLRRKTVQHLYSQQLKRAHNPNAWQYHRHTLAPAHQLPPRGTVLDHQRFQYLDPTNPWGGSSPDPVRWGGGRGGCDHSLRLYVGFVCKIWIHRFFMKWLNFAFPDLWVPFSGVKFRAGSIFEV